jgi:23S rRNA pseudouridine1911/1915/1917 synthase
VTQPIGKLPHPTLTYVYGATPDGRFARSDCRVLQRRSEATLLAVSLLTGRPHQIRIHLAAAGYPLLGDPLYLAGGIPRIPLDSSATPVPGDCGYHLHAEQLTLTHPRSAERLTFTYPVPAALR